MAPPLKFYYYSGLAEDRKLSLRLQKIQVKDANTLISFIEGLELMYNCFD